MAIAADLVEREVDRHRWVANDPWFMPGAMIDNMPAFQQGIVSAVSRFAVELTDQISRVRGSSQIDADADAAAGRLKYPGDIWIFEWSSTPVQQSSEAAYRRAIVHLRRYNDRLAAGDAVFDRRADNLMTTLDRIASDLGSSSAALFEKIDTSADSWMDLTADDLFYANKGRLFGYSMLLTGLGDDFRDVLRARQADALWEATIASFAAAAALQPWVVVNGALDSQLKPNHLAGQGFLLMRARTQLREVTNILLK